MCRVTLWFGRHGIVLKRLHIPLWFIDDVTDFFFFFPTVNPFCQLAPLNKIAHSLIRPQFRASALNNRSLSEKNRQLMTFPSIYSNNLENIAKPFNYLWLNFPSKRFLYLSGGKKSFFFTRSAADEQLNSIACSFWSVQNIGLKIKRQRSSGRSSTFWCFVQKQVGWLQTALMVRIGEWASFWPLVISFHGCMEARRQAAEGAWVRAWWSTQSRLAKTLELGVP